MLNPSVAECSNSTSIRVEACHHFEEAEVERLMGGGKFSGEMPEKSKPPVNLHSIWPYTSSNNALHLNPGIKNLNSMDIILFHLVARPGRESHQSVQQGDALKMERGGRTLNCFAAGYDCGGGRQ